MKFDGLVDYGGDSTITNKSDKLADHALVMMFRCYRSKWVRLIAVYATSSATTSIVIQNIVVKAMKALEKKGAVVTNVVCDGHPTNKGVHRLFGVSGEMKNVTHYNKHPTNQDEKIYFLFDVPHIMTCIRNHIFTHKFVQVNTLLIRFRKLILKKC
ncbi:hypothetical protein GHT06_009089 [Daphnia sinensis]|uniref:Transposable element P transposase-like RNase H domain-containing protein n=1 Tax=Daphnia sinensis TaxID=1820382 RepID=A0AAD5LM93_9CRUS|nr:hypothetical protein GHT06_009089 [Daphnia sinensis]